VVFLPLICSAFMMKIFPSSLAPNPALRFIQPPCQWITGTRSIRLRWQGYEDNKLRMSGFFPLISCKPSWRAKIIFTFYLYLHEELITKQTSKFCIRFIYGYRLKVSRRRSFWNIWFTNNILCPYEIQEIMFHVLQH
jgi:hypothetical protein